MTERSDRRTPSPLSITTYWLCAVLFTGSSLAQATQETDALIEHGLEMRRQGDEDGASREFRKAYELSPTPRASAELGLSERALGHWAQAEAHLREALGAVSDPWIARNQVMLQNARRAVQQHVGSPEGHGTVNVTQPPAAIDGSQTLGWAGSGPAPGVDTGQSPDSTWRTLGIATMGVGGGLLVGGVAAQVVNALRMGVYNGDQCADYGLLFSRPVRCGSIKNEADTAQTLAIVGYAAGGALAITGLVLLLAAPSHHAPVRQSAGLTCGQGPGDVGLACGARF